MYIHVKVKADAKKEILRRINETHFEIAVKEPAERNLANGRIIEMVSGQFRLASGKVRIVSGHHSPSKILSVELSAEKEI